MLNFLKKYPLNKYSIFILLLLFTAFALQTKLLFSPDVAYLLHATKQLLAGQKYGIDIFETNPPLILYLYTPIILFAKIFRFAVFESARIYFFLLATISLITCYQLFKLIKLPLAILVSVLAALIFAFYFLPMLEFGQRDHLVVLLTLPYFFAAVCRLENKRLNPYLALLIGILAGCGFGLKPFYLFPLLLVEVLVLVKTKKLFAVFRLESFVVILIISLYLVSIYLFEINYLKIELPLIFRYYFEGAKQDNFTIFSNLLVLYSLACLCITTFLQKNSKFKNLLQVCLLAELGFIFAFLLPRSAWYCHILPALSIACLLFSMLIGEYIENNKLTLSKNFLLLSGLIFFTFFIPAYNCFRMFKSFNQQNQTLINPVKKFILQLHQPQSISCFTANSIAACYPLVYETKNHFTSRFPFFWWYTGLNRTSDTPLKAQDKNLLINFVADDLTRNQTQLVIVDNRYFDFVTDFSKNSNFSHAWQSYQLLTKIGSYSLYQRKRF